VSKLVKSAKHSIVLIDNYIDESVLVLFRNAPKCGADSFDQASIQQIGTRCAQFNEQYRPLRYGNSPRPMIAL
jgi:hypothetical protein